MLLQSTHGQTVPCPNVGFHHRGPLLSPEAGYEMRIVVHCGLLDRIFQLHAVSLPAESDVCKKSSTVLHRASEKPLPTNKLQPLCSCRP